MRLVGTLGTFPQGGHERHGSLPPSSASRGSVPVSADETSRNSGHSVHFSDDDASWRELPGSATITFCSEMRRKLCMCLQREGAAAGPLSLVNSVGYEGAKNDGDGKQPALGLSVEDLLRAGDARLQSRRALEAAAYNKQNLSSMFPYRVPSSISRSATATASRLGSRAFREPTQLQLQLSRANGSSELDPLHPTESIAAASANEAFDHEVTFAPPPTPTGHEFPNSKTPNSGSSSRVVQRYTTTSERSILRVRGLVPHALDSAPPIAARHTYSNSNSNFNSNSNTNTPPISCSTRSTPACAPRAAARDASRATSTSGHQRLQQQSVLRAQTAAAFTAQRDWRAQHQQNEQPSHPPANPQCPCPQCRTPHTSRTGAGGLLPVALGFQDCRELSSITLAVAKERRIGGIEGGRVPPSFPHPQLVLEGISPSSK